jgi:hypothetical protein
MGEYMYEYVYEWVDGGSVESVFLLPLTLSPLACSLYCNTNIGLYTSVLPPSSYLIPARMLFHRLWCIDNAATNLSHARRDTRNRQRDSTGVGRMDGDG